MKNSLPTLGFIVSLFSCDLTQKEENLALKSSGFFNLLEKDREIECLENNKNPTPKLKTNKEKTDFLNFYFKFCEKTIDEALKAIFTDSEFTTDYLFKEVFSLKEQGLIGEEFISGYKIIIEQVTKIKNEIKLNGKRNDFARSYDYIIPYIGILDCFLEELKTISTKPEIWAFDSENPSLDFAYDLDLFYSYIKKSPERSSPMKNGMKLDTSKQFGKLEINHLILRIKEQYYLRLKIKELG